MRICANTLCNKVHKKNFFFFRKHVFTYIFKIPVYFSAVKVNLKPVILENILTFQSNTTTSILRKKKHYDWVQSQMHSPPYITDTVPLSTKSHLISFQVNSLFLDYHRTNNEPETKKYLLYKQVFFLFVTENSIILCV